MSKQVVHIVTAGFLSVKLISDNDCRSCLKLYEVDVPVINHKIYPIKISVLWDMTPCILVNKFLQNADNVLPNYMASRPRKP
jgi:hypothetical protein